MLGYGNIFVLNFEKKVDDLEGIKKSEIYNFLNFFEYDLCFSLKSNEYECN